MRAKWALYLVALSLLSSSPSCQAQEESDEETCLWGENEICNKAARDGIAQDIKDRCPLMDSRFTPGVLWLLRQTAKPTTLLQTLGLWPKGITQENWGDSYTSVSYLFVVRIALGLYKARDKNWVNVPDAMSDPGDIVRVENIVAPHYDPDGTPNFFWFEGVVPNFILKRVYVPMLTCFYSILRRLSTHNWKLNGTFADTLDDPNSNTWDVVLKDSPYKTKRDWVMAFYDIAKAWDSKPLWPQQMTDFQPYWKQDEWDDRLEYAIAFNLIGTHRLESGSWSFEGLPGTGSVKNLPFRIPLNSFSAFDVRDGFGRYGGDLYFNDDGLPVLIQTPDGSFVARGDKTWQYWKFVWRSTLVTGITLVDHLHMTHFRVGNLMSRSCRVSLPAKHAFRRFMSIFTFGTIFVNMQAMHTLIGPKHLLHRATPFKKFTELSQTVPKAAIVDIPENPGIKPLLDDKEWNKLHPKLQASPYFADGRLVMKAFHKLVTNVLDVLYVQVCTKDTGVTPEFRALLDEVVNETVTAEYQVDPAYIRALRDKSLSCDTFRKLLAARMASYMFVVTAWHRQVGFVGDYYGDPQLATMSWKEGEPYGRPRQHMIMTVINVFTSTHQPLLKEDYSHMFKGIEPDRSTELTKCWKDFQKELAEIETEIDRRNEKREIKNLNGSPRVLESAVSK